eukprot:335875-Amphidinium_carterae.6
MFPQEAAAAMHPSSIVGDVALGACTGRVDALWGRCSQHVGTTDHANSEFVSAFMTAPVSRQSPGLVTGSSEQAACSAGQLRPSFSDTHAAMGASCCEGASVDLHPVGIEAWNSSLASPRQECNLGQTSQAKAQQNPINVSPVQELSFLCDKLHSDGVDVACLQETRLNLPAGFATKTFDIIQNPAIKGIGGLVIAVAKKDGHEVLQHRCIGPRVLTALVKMHGKPFFVLCAHAPIRKAPAQEHLDFALAVEAALGNKPKAAKLLGGADLNARVAQQVDGITISGPLASRCPYAAMHARPLMRVLQRHQMHLVNTFLDSNGLWDERVRTEVVNGDSIQSSIVTWQHPRTKREYQIEVCGG